MRDGLIMFEYECWKCNEWHNLGEDVTTWTEALRVSAQTGTEVRLTQSDNKRISF